MRSQEAAIRITNELGMLYPDINQQIVRQAIEGILYDYEITTKETLPAVMDNMNDMILLYLATKMTEGLSDLTIKSYGRGLGRFANVMRRNVEDITTMDLRVYISNYSKTGVKNTTVAGHTDILRGFFNWLAEEEYINRSPMTKIKSVKVEKRIREALTKEEFEILRQGAKTLRQKALLEFFYSTGCRLEEVESIKKTDIDWQRLSLKVIGKGNKERTVFINATALVHLKKYLMSRLDECDALFITERQPIKAMGKRAIQREIDKIKEQSGLERNVYPHLLRHSAATHWLNSGMDITVVKEILGHDELGTTEIYAQISNQEVEHAYKKYS